MYNAYFIVCCAIYIVYFIKKKAVAYISTQVSQHPLCCFASCSIWALAGDHDGLKYEVVAKNITNVMCCASSLVKASNPNLYPTDYPYDNNS